MRDVIPELRRWQQAGKTEIAVATILETRGSSLRPAGTRMLLTSEGDVAGSVSSGCVDGDVIAEMEAVLGGIATVRHPAYGISDEQAWGVGLSCGGEMDLMVERWNPLHDAFAQEIEEQRAVGFASRIDHPAPDGPAHLLHRSDGETLGELGHPDLDGQVLMDIAAVWPGPYVKRHKYPQGEVLIEVIPPPPVLVIFGATDIAMALSQIAQICGFEVVVSDPRQTFARAERFPGALLHLGWPNEFAEWLTSDAPPAFWKADDGHREVSGERSLGLGWAMVVLFHDPKIDIPALSLALRSRAFYIGLLGSRKTQADRRASLLAAGFREHELDRIHGPAGLDISSGDTPEAKSPALIALSIMAEVIAVRHRRR
jgi:xanthine dehydrogenase accessory factor